jgi:50S ribosomal subunit-associated GTPase HflX
VKRALIIGRTNVGKTLFCIHFAEYLGLTNLGWWLEHSDGRTERRQMSVREAEAVLTNASPHFTQSLQSLQIEVPRGKVGYRLMLTDSTGLTDGIHPAPPLRNAMAQTLEALLDADVILHMVDAAQPSWDSLDQQIFAYGRRSKRYLVLANKIDLPTAKRGYRKLVRHVSQQLVLPVSALCGSGFREVRQCVWRMA